LRFDAEMYDRHGIRRIAGSNERITKFLVNLCVLTKKIPLPISVSLDAKMQVPRIDCCRTLTAEHLRVSSLWCKSGYLKEKMV
jgi:hypothetical protein